MKAFDSGDQQVPRFLPSPGPGTGPAAALLDRRALPGLSGKVLLYDERVDSTKPGGEKNKTNPCGALTFGFLMSGSGIIVTLADKLSTLVECKTFA